MRWWRVSVGVVVVAAMGLGFLEWISPVREFEYERQVNIPLSKKPSSPDEALPEIWERARRWRSDLVLDGIGIRFPPHSIRLEDATYSYGFTSRWQRLWSTWWLNLILRVDAKAGTVVREISIAGDAHNAGTDIHFSSWKVSSQEALQLAEAKGGREFRERVPDFMLAMSATGGWTVWYGYTRDRAVFLEIVVNPHTGEAKIMHDPWKELQGGER